MKRSSISIIIITGVSLLAAACCLAQQSPSSPTPPASSSAPPTSTAPSEPTGPAGESSSHDTRIDISPPRDDAKNHPGSKEAVSDFDAPDAITAPDASGVQEFHPWNPLKANKSIEVGDYYFKRKNYKAARERYKDALYYKEGDALASYRLAVCEEKLGDKTEARKYFEQYLKILPEGPFAKEAKSSLDRLASK